MSPAHNLTQITNIEPKPSGLVTIESKRIDQSKMALINQDITDALKTVLDKHGLKLTRQIPRLEDSREMSIIIRASVVDLNGFDSLHRDLLEYAHVMGFKASIMNQVIISDNVEYQVSGLDLSITNDRKFRLTSSGSTRYMKFESVKEALPEYFI